VLSSVSCLIGNPFHSLVATTYSIIQICHLSLDPTLFKLGTARLKRMAETFRLSSEILQDFFVVEPLYFQLACSERPELFSGFVNLLFRPDMSPAVTAHLSVNTVHLSVVGDRTLLRISGFWLGLTISWLALYRIWWVCIYGNCYLYML
jgi:hypothetical protein